MALEEEDAQDDSELHFDYAWSLAKEKRTEEAALEYKKCLDLDPDRPNVRNNLGLELYRQGKLTAALEMFELAIQYGLDGRFPLQNKARCLHKLKRYQEAITAWIAVKPGNKPIKWIQTQIDIAQKLLDRGPKDEPSSAEEDDSDPAKSSEEEEEDGELDAPSRQQEPELPVQNQIDGKETQSPLKSSKSATKPGSTKKSQDVSSRTASQNEMLLEESIEKLILSGQRVFGRHLKIYKAPDGSSGRQFTIADPMCRGRIDLLTEDAESGELVVIELKKDESHHDVVGQIGMIFPPGHGQ